MKQLFLTITLLCCSLFTFAGSKSSATTISPKTNCNHTAGQWGGGIKLNLTPAETGSRKDQYFKFTATKYGYEISYSYAISYTVESDDPEAKVTYNGDAFTVSKLDAEYYLRIYTWSSSSSTLTQYMCFYTVAPNSEKDDAIELTAGTPCYSDGNAFKNATSSGVSTSCETDEYTDIWFSFTAQSTMYDFSANTNTSSSFKMEVLDGSIVKKCASGIITAGNSIATATFSLSNLTVGKTYHIRAFKHWSNGDLKFNVCATPNGIVSTTPIANATRKAIAAYNLQGQQVPLDTRGAVIILRYDDGSKETRFVVE